MIRSLVTLLFLAALAAGCGAAPSTIAQGGTQADMLSACPLSIREVFDEGKVARYPFIRPEHITAIESALPRFPGEERAILVRLTHEGEGSMLSYMQSGVGDTVAFFCGETEMSRTKTLEPIANGIRVVMPLPAGS